MGIEDFVVTGAGGSTHRIQGFDGVHFYSPAGLIALFHLALSDRHTTPPVDVPYIIHSQSLLQNINIQKRYTSFVNRGRQLGKITALLVMPGCDDSQIGRESHKIISSENGALYKKLWKAAIKANPDWVLITSFNEWHEGTEIEPGIEY